MTVKQILNIYDMIIMKKKEQIVGKGKRGDQSKSVQMMEAEAMIPKKRLQKIGEKKKEEPKETPPEPKKKPAAKAAKKKKRDLFKLVNPDKAAR